MSGGGEAAAAAEANLRYTQLGWAGGRSYFWSDSSPPALVVVEVGGQGDHTAAQALIRRQERRMDSLFTQAVRGLEHEGGKCQ